LTSQHLGSGASNTRKDSVPESRQARLSLSQRERSAASIVEAGVVAL